MMKTKEDVLSWDQNESKTFSWSYPNPAGNDQWSMQGFIETNDHAADLLKWYGLKITATEIAAPIEGELLLHCSLKRNPAPEAVIKISAPVVLLPGESIWVPFASFNCELGMEIVFKAVLGVELIGLPDDCVINELSFNRAKHLYINAPIKGKGIEDKAIYDFSVTNLEANPVWAVPQIRKQGWEILTTELVCEEEVCDNQPLLFAAGETRNFSLEVTPTDRFSEHGIEKQQIDFFCSGDVESCTFYTVRHSKDYLTTLCREDIQAIKEKILHYDWAKEKYKQLYDRADQWQVPIIDITQPYLFLTRESDEAGNAALIGLLSGERRFLEKATAFLKEFIHPEKGYGHLPHAGHQELVHEGEFFKHTALTYDRIKSTGLLNKDEEKRLQSAFRTFMKIIEDECTRGKVSNWNLAELSGVITCAAVMEDMEQIVFFLETVNGVKDHLARGIMDDGWWYEASIGYNLLAMGLFLEIAQTIDKWGFNLRHEEVPANFATYYNLDQKIMAAEDRIDGLSNDVWGPSKNNTRSMEMLIDSMIAFYDESGVIFGMNDSEESHAVGISLMDPRFDLAYHMYGKENLVPLLHTVADEDRDLLFGVAELPEVTEDMLAVHRRSVRADVAGISLLRSQRAGRKTEEQYQVGVKTGILGGAHGHYDRLALNSIRRYGKNFYNPENIWYAYHTFMYKFYVQNSITHNMTTVDLKQQDPAEAVTKKFHSDEQLQYVIHECKTKWCNPPYGGWRVGENETFTERCWNEGRHVPIPDETPEYTRRTDYTEDIIQRRCVIVTDDYVVVVDYLEGNQEHDFDCLYHVSGLQGIFGKDTEAKTYRLTEDQCNSLSFAIADTDDLSYSGCREQLTTDPLSSGQFITECHRLVAKDQVTVRFSVEMSKYNDKGWLTSLRTSENTPGLMNMDIHCLTSTDEVLIACDPEYQQTQQQLRYRVLLDDQVLYESHLGTWVLGRDDIHLALSQGKELVLETVTNYVSNEYGAGKDVPLPAVFWGEGSVTLTDGRRLLLSELEYQMENIKPVPEENRDYFGGPVKLQAKEMKQSLPGTPADEGTVGRLLFNVEGLKLSKIDVAIGGDYPLGDESDRRRMLSFRKRSSAAEFVTVLEQFDEQPVIKELSYEKGSIIVTKADGTVDIVTIDDKTLADATVTLNQSVKATENA